ncbi:MAG: type II CAAX prenyl endopeptidase Rce1 family protein [Candidatus Woesearchaeota archaeon]
MVNHIILHCFYGAYNIIRIQAPSVRFYNPFVASIIIGLFWVFWHLPLFFVEMSSQYGLPIGWYTINGMALSIIFTWLYIKSNNSTLLAIILHGGINAAFAYYPGLADIETGLGTISYYAPITIGSWILALILLIVYRKLFFKARLD